MNKHHTFISLFTPLPVPVPLPLPVIVPLYRDVILLLGKDLAIAVRTVIANFRFNFQSHEKLALVKATR